ncbi:MAG: histidine phosphatase family protein [Chromatiales bacterium]|nr:histidine phosphatase family protein [Chromatiales bacterium]
MVILVRHAEAATSAGGDPDLNSAGERRAALLGSFLADALPGRSVDHLYAADTRRAQQTAASVANQFKLPINLLAASDWAGLVSRIKRDHRGETVVVVGYASTLPGVLNQLSASHHGARAGRLRLDLRRRDAEPGAAAHRPAAVRRACRCRLTAEAR